MNFDDHAFFNVFKTITIFTIQNYYYIQRRKKKHEEKKERNFDIPRQRCNGVYTGKHILACFFFSLLTLVDHRKFNHYDIN